MQRVEEVTEVVYDQAAIHPTSSYMRALAKLESTQRHKEKMEKELENTTNLWNTRVEIALREQRGKMADERREDRMRSNLEKRKENLRVASKSNKKAEDWFIAMFLEAVEVYLDVRTRFCIRISRSLDFFSKGWK